MRGEFTKNEAESALRGINELYAALPAEKRDDVRDSLADATAFICRARDAAPDLNQTPVLRTKRGCQLILPERVTNTTLSLELAEKWYSLYLVNPGADDEPPKVEEIQGGYECLEDHAPEGHGPYVDHVPNPMALGAFAEAHGYHLPGCVLEMVIGRWMLEVEGGMTCR